MTTTFTGINLVEAHPPGCCSYCAQHGIEHAASGAQFVRCMHTETGAFRRPGGDWIQIQNISESEFKREMLAATLQIEIAIFEAAADGMTEQ